MINKNIINSKFNLIRDYLKELEEIIDLKNDEILNDFKKIRTLERDF